MIDRIQFPIEEMFEEGLTRPHVKRGRKRRERAAPSEPVQTGIVIQEIHPKTENQEKAFEFFARKKHLLLHGVSGTGKTFIACYLAIKAVMDTGTKFDKIVIVRSSVPSRDQGFMPGSAKDKAAVYEVPYQAHFTEILGRADAYTILKNKKMVEFVTTSFLRGTNITNAIVIVDEMQNMSDMELHTIITRLGHDTRLILCGDYRQDDLTGKKGETSGLKNIFKILNSMPTVGSVDFKIEDVVRSGFVKEYLLKRHELGIDPPNM